MESSDEESEQLEVNIDTNELHELYIHLDNMFPYLFHNIRYPNFLDFIEQKLDRDRDRNCAGYYIDEYYKEIKIIQYYLPYKNCVSIANFLWNYR